MSDSLNYEKDIHIDEDQLDIEWLEQPTLMLKYCRHEAETEQKFEIEKTKLDLLKSELDNQIRKNPKDFGLEGIKITEAVVSNTILASEEYQDAYIEYMDVKFERDMAKNAVKAISQRKDALENLVKLHGQSYFAGPKMPRNIHEERQQRNKAVNEKIATSMKRQRK